MIYASEHPALAIIEFLVNVGDRKLIPEGTTLYSIEVPGDIPVQNLPCNFPAANWKRSTAETREYGTQWLDRADELVLQIPAATTEGNNFLINPRHRDISKLLIVDRIAQPFDDRLIALK